ncbi:MAG: hypothetical protein IKU07_08995 [Oscillospiraceae bacterium]|nr:hypothetical protein [Oscillospiraceae bacterium]
MKKAIIIAAAAIVVIISLFIMNAYVKIPINDALSFYDNAVNKLDEHNIGYRIVMVKESKIGDEIYQEESVKTVYLKSADTAIQAYTDAQILVNGEPISVTEWYENGTLYSAVNNSYFSTPMTLESYQSRVLPFLLADSLLYNTITGTKHKNGYTILLTEITGKESWMAEEIETIDSADAKVSFTRNGHIKTLQYNTNYQTAYSNEKLTITTEFITDSPKILPFDKANAEPVDSADMVLELEQACTRIIASKTLKTHATQTLLCEVFGDKKIVNTEITIDATNGWSSSVRQTISLANTGKPGAGTTLTREEIFKNGTYSLLIDGVDSKPEHEKSANEVRASVQNLLISDIILPEEIKHYEIAKSDEEITYSFIPSEALEKQLRDNALGNLYGDTHILDAEAAQYTLTEAYFYLTLDATTKIPKASGLRYTGIYTINELTYTLEYKLHQDYEILN